MDVKGGGLENLRLSWGQGGENGEESGWRVDGDRAPIEVGCLHRTLGLARLVWEMLASAGTVR